MFYTVNFPVLGYIYILGFLIYTHKKGNCSNEKLSVQILNFSLPCPLAPPSGQNMYCCSINGSDSEVCGLLVVVAAVYTIT